MLAAALSGHPKVLALHEPRPYLNGEAYRKWSGVFPRERLIRSIRGKRRMIDQIERNGLLYFESSHFLSHLIPELTELYDGRYIHLYRDGRDFVRSGLQRGWWYADRSDWTLKHMIRRWLRRKFFIEFSDAGWEDHRLEPPRGLKSRMQKIAWLWTEINSVILSDLQELPSSDRLALKLEDFGENSVKLVLDFLALPSTRSVVEQIVRVVKSKPNKTGNLEVPEFSEWPEEKKKEFWQVAGAMMERLGYRR